MNELKGLGHFDGKTHILPIRVYYEDTDLSGVVYHANYLRYMERGRTEFFRAVGIKLAGLEDAEPTAWTLRKVQLEYFRPARLEDQLEVRTTCSSVTGARMTADQRIYAGDTLLTHGTVEACIITLSGKPRRIPQDVRDKLAPFLYEER
ncbi:MAG TPA: tol-pal system-associated acyl-CoA thioesterase [Rhizomicrobium sp.]|jgi:acyl-CoA thioester hydrolase|nr:tol-pal system-associated acyl-CoA thioesterase [Rhizomicrobium sp.]